MISDDDGLRRTRETLAQVESILVSYRRDLGHDLANYLFYAGTTIDLYLSVRSDLDAYLGIDGSRRPDQAEGVLRAHPEPQTFVLAERPGGLPDLLCECAESLEAEVSERFGRRARVGGILATSRVTGRQRMEVEWFEAVSSAEDSADAQPTDNADLVSR